ncbi:MAG: substrate-binding domain-containing protein [Kiritimatiellae bacterium]|nr:substrate-binding domain-containing protein [Kiritimatiellia bacterium]
MKSAKANVVVAIPTNGSDGREHLSGVFDYVSEHPHWMVQTINMRTAIVNGTLYDALKGADGLILYIAYDIDRLADTIISENPHLKIVVTNEYLVPLFAKHPYCRSLLIDSISVGKDAARYFNSLGRFASYGFVHGAIRFPWSIEREKGFRSAMPRNTPLFEFPKSKSGTVQTGPEAPTISLDELATWLDRLPKPTAVFGANDLFAAKVLTVCDQLGFKVPGQVTVIGCDNDPLVFSNTIPPLSSLQLPFRELGYKAAATLDKLLHHRNPSRRTIHVAGTHLFGRGSSAHIPPATALVEKAREYIAEHACDGIRPNDVIAHVGVSRSLLNLRFRQASGKSINEDIIDVRLAEVCQQLERTDHTILQIGRDCGFNDPDHLKRLFKKRFGATMRQYRSQSTGR